MAPRRDAADIMEALTANNALVRELQIVEKSLIQEETKLVVKIQSLRQRMALRRAEQAMATLLPRAPIQNTIVQNYNKNPRTRKKSLGVVPRSYIRQHVSFFTDEVVNERKIGRPKKKKQQTLVADHAIDFEEKVLEKLLEPLPNADTEFLRAHSHESLIANPPTIFSIRERKVVRDFAEDFYMTHDENVDIPLQVWNGIQAWQEKRKSRQFPIERSGFACKLWYDLHESPKLRLGAWTKEEDVALRRLATGEVDKQLVNRWHEIAKHMPIPGRPAAHCLTRYQTTLCAGNTRSSFTPEEDQILREAVPVFGEKWNVIADLLDGRVSEQIRHRWQLSLAPGLRRGKFSLIEDRRMLLALRAYVPKNSEFNQDQVSWSDICHHLPGRTQPAIRDRYTNCLNPDLSFRKFTKQEDELILTRVREWGIESSRLWPRLAAELGDRTNSQVCRRWRYLDPKGYDKRRRVLEEASKSQTTAVFRRRSIHRHDPCYRKIHTKRSSYNGLAVDRADVIQEASRTFLQGRTNEATDEQLQIRETECEDGSTEYTL
ncbi:unnamed protein product [Peronospora effusa]|uniref:Uncharacterized protein n=1 Tax=Peronospora effusa TaxID=542832 RepID=A0A3M6V6R3_9STRA|nr:hypothetical protein DD238_004711 [Peronospora effusa]RQM17927.1 hypothetical protein DD237_002655 [Peronospora effusa]CAI5729016.1 unnamed protein product [Peronospora effusa]